MDYKTLCNLSSKQEVVSYFLNQNNSLLRNMKTNITFVEKSIPLFNHRTEPNDVCQGFLNNCWLVSVMQFLSKDVDYIKVPYRSNRAVIFNSKLYHVTDKIEFSDNYKDRRVNVTFLYK